MIVNLKNDSTNHFYLFYFPSDFNLKMFIFIFVKFYKLSRDVVKKNLKPMKLLTIVHQVLNKSDMNLLNPVKQLPVTFQVPKIF